jgi:hypothetical protein
MNKRLYNKLCSLTMPSESSSQSQVEEPPFTDCPEDHSNMPVPVLINTLTGQPQEGFLMSTDGSLKQNAIAKSEGVGGELPILEGHPKRARQPQVLFGGIELWYEH